VLRIFFALKNPMASAGFEAQHATPRPPKPLKNLYTLLYIVVNKILKRYADNFISSFDDKIYLNQGSPNIYDIGLHGYCGVVRGPHVD
jgi:hypothetical protein